MSAPARAAFALTLVASLAVAEPPFPLSRYPMYARLDGRDEGAVPLHLADGAPADLTAYVGFTGVPEEALRPRGVPISEGYRTLAAARWVADHPGDAPGPVRIEVGYRRLRVVAGALVEEPVILATGAAWPAP